MSRLLTWLGLLVGAGLLFPVPLVLANDAAAIPQALHDYVKRPDAEFAWKVKGQREAGGFRIDDLEVTSQRWQDIVWKHHVLIFHPTKNQHPNHLLLFVTGGRTGREPGAGELLLGTSLAERTQSRVAMLFQVPNQPLMGDRVEDDLITETWLRYLQTGDPTWPLLFPMVKSAVRTMDALEQLAAQQWNTQLDGFVIAGASKRGWTSWLTPVADRRVLGTVPMVIDTLNFPAQMRHQLATWGEYSEQIFDYSSKGLIKLENESPREKSLWAMMDPYTYRRELSLPKLLVHGTNDRYWVVDATRFYWHDLVGPKYILQVPNAGHGLEGGRDKALSTVAAFYRQTVLGQPLPVLQWEHQDQNEDWVLKVNADQQPTAARFWIARSETRDFREARWNSQPMAQEQRAYQGRINKAAGSHLARFAELEFEFDGLPYSLCTLIQAD